MSFLIALLLTCLAIYIANVAKEEMVGIFAAIIAILSFVISVFLAPWFIQVSLLIFVAVFWRGLTLR